MNYQNYNHTQKPSPNNNNNTGLIITIAALSCLLVVVLVLVVLLATGAIGGSEPNPTGTTSTSALQQPAQPQQPQQADEPAPQPHQPAEPQPIPVNQTMYVDCNTYLSLRSGPGTGYTEITRIPVGSAVYVIEYTNSDFARATYGGSEGYVARQYLSSSQPYVWNYSDSAVQNLVADSVRGYVHAINTGDTSFAHNYFTGSAVSSEIASVNANRKVAASETILSLNCHSVTRVSKTKVTVIRDSTIRVYYHNGDVKDVVEKYKYTVEYINGDMYITSLSEM